jgi:hypothetical protein
MNKQEVRNMIYAGLRKVLPEPDFRLRKSEGAFVRKTSTGLQKIFVPLVDYNPEYIFSLTVGIRIDAVEEIFNRVSGADDKGQKLTLTSITQLAHFTHGNRKDYRVSTPADIDAALSELSGVIDQEIMPFLLQYQDVQSLDLALNSEKQLTFDSSILISHAMHSIILARLVGNEQYPELVKAFAKQIECFPPADRERFVQLESLLTGSIP